MTQVSREREDGKIICLVDNVPCHSVQVYLKNNHPEISFDDYRRRYPDAPILSQFAIEQLAAKRKKGQDAAGSRAPVTAADEAPAPPRVAGKAAFHEVFGLGKASAALLKDGGPIMIDVFEKPGDEYAEFFPLEDPNYVFDIAQTKDVIIGLALNKNQYFWGFHGSGKTSGFEQVCFRTNRLWSRLQHTVDMESSAVIGQYVVKNGATVWQDGPLPIAMKIGAVFCADEYDVAQPGVIALYQAVLEGRPLIIKEAPPEFRVVRAHANFRFVATGNTNGSGDETGLYQGTQLQNAANYSRFGLTRKVEYVEDKIEVAIIKAQARVIEADAKKFVQFAKEVRKAFAAKTIGCIASTREMINAAELGLVKGLAWREGLRLGFINRQSSIDAEVLEQYAQRIFG